MSAERLNAVERNDSQMNLEYQFLIGHQFNLDGKLFKVRDIVVIDQCVFVNAESESHGQTTARRFPAATAIESLLVEEEIELFSPNFVSVAR
ncbi:MAG: hypothetical protein O7G86_14690 [Gammaproteobacteria bacterium]|nr:hypothetical protein [Gammaproteobacteria bacterium]